MKKRAVEVTANVINEKLKKGIFLTSKSGDKVNSMVIGWGHIGRVWERPVFIAYVRTSRSPFVYTIHKRHLTTVRHDNQSIAL